MQKKTKTFNGVKILIWKGKAIVFQALGGTTTCVKK